MRDPIAVLRTGSPEPDARLAALFAAAAAPAERPVPGEEGALAAFRAEFAADALPAMGSQLPSDPTRRSMKSRTTKLVAASAIGAFTVLGGGYAAAATDALPESASDAARAALAAVGLPGPSAQAGDKPADSATTHTKSATGSEHSAEAGAKAQENSAETPASDPTANDHGQLVSTTARADYASGQERGEAVSGVASSKSSASSNSTDSGTSTQEREDEEAAKDGRATATEQSGGASDLGADNADVERP